MGKQVAQGTAYETAIVKRALSLGRKAWRTAKAGQKDEADVIIEGEVMVAAVFWRNLVKLDTGKKRRAVHMVVIPEEVFWKIISLDLAPEIGYYVQAKATQTLGVRTTLEGLVSWQQRKEL